MTLFYTKASFLAVLTCHLTKRVSQVGGLGCLRRADGLPKVGASHLRPHLRAPKRGCGSNAHSSKPETCPDVPDLSQVLCLEANKGSLVFGCGANVLCPDSLSWLQGFGACVSTCSTGGLVPESPARAPVATASHTRHGASQDGRLVHLPVGAGSELQGSLRGGPRAFGGCFG